MINNLPRRLTNIGAPGEPFVITGTIFNKTMEIVFWDVVWPKLKYYIFIPYYLTV